jgi:hypothetical protein
MDMVDVRCRLNGQANCAGGAGSLYGGKLLMQLPIQTTDRLNDGQFAAPATAQDLTLNFGFQCAAGSCNATTSADSVYPNVVKEGKRAVWSLSQLSVLDGGSDGDLVAAPSPASGPCPPACVGNGGEGVFLRQGLSVP